MAAAERHSIKSWAARLSADGEALTLEEAHALAAIAAADRLLEMRDAVSDVRARLTRLELYLAATVPGYDPATRALAARLAEQSDAASRTGSDPLPVCDGTDGGPIMSDGSEAPSDERLRHVAAAAGAARPGRAGLLDVAAAHRREFPMSLAVVLLVLVVVFIILRAQGVF